MEALTRIAVFLVIGGLLLLANVWFVRAVVENLGHRGVVIAPIEVIGGSDVAATGRTLASLLQARLQQLQSDLQRAQESLVAAPRASPASADAAEPVATEEGKPGPPMPRFWAEPIRLDAALFQPIDISATVGGVDVGRLVPWMQRLVAQPQTLNFTVSFEGDHALVAGDIRPLGTPTGSVWLQTAATTPAKIADLIAHELILRQLASDSRNRFDLLNVQEFQALSSTLTEAARLNDLIARGRPVRQELGGLLPGLDSLVEKLPNWTELLFFAGTVAESAGSRERAVSYYSRLDNALAANGGTEPERRNAVKARLAELRTALPEGFYAGLGRRIVAVTGLFEVGSDSLDRIFGTVYGDFAKHEDIYFGAASWNFRTKTLGPLLRELENADPDRFTRALGEGHAELAAVLEGPPEDAAAFARRIQDDRARIQDPWRSRFEALGREPKFQDVQMRTLEPYFRRAVDLADTFGLRSERGLALVYNVVILQGSTLRQRWPAAIETFRREQGREPGEVERMGLVVDIATSRTASSFRERVRARYTTFVNGKSAAPPVDLEQRAIRLADFRTGERLGESASFH